jgi:hypothetical protein
VETNLLTGAYLIAYIYATGRAVAHQYGREVRNLTTVGHNGFYLFGHLGLDITG